MPRIPQFVALATCAVTACTAASAQQVQHAADAFPTDGYIHCTIGDQQWIAFRIVDALDGRPVAGAELLLLREGETPLPGRSWFSRRVLSDEAGFVRARVDDIPKYHQLVIRAMGHGVCATSTPPGAVWPIARAHDVPVEVLDWRGRPTAGALISFCGGCGHTPDLAFATSGKDGIATLLQIDPHNHINDLYAQHDALGLGYDNFLWHPGDPAVRFECGYGEAVTGRLLDATGQPVGGAFIGSRDVHRGPWCETRADGTFTLMGSRLPLSLCAVTAAGETFFRDTPGGEVLLRLPDPAAEDADGTLQQVRDPATAAAPAMKAIAVRCELDVTQDETGIVLEWPRGRTRPTADELRSGSLQVPATGPFAFRVERSGSVRWHVFDRAADVPQPLLLAACEPTQLRAEVVDDNGATLAVRAQLLRFGRYGADSRAAWFAPTAGTAFGDGKVVLPAFGHGLHLLVLTAGDAATPRILCPSLPRAAGGTLDLGRIVLRVQPQVTVLDASGVPLAAAELQLLRDGCFETDSPPRFDLDHRGIWRGPDLQAGDALRYEPEGADDEVVLACRWTIGRQIESVLRVPDGKFELNVVDAAGDPVKATVVLGDQDFEMFGATRVRCVPQGKHRLFVSADGQQTAIVDVEVTTAAQTVRVQLRPRGS